MSFSTQYSLVAATALRRKPTAMRPFSIWPLPAHLAPSAARRLRLFSFPQSTVLALSRLQPSPTATLCFPVSPDLSGATQFERDFSTREKLPYELTAQSSAYVSTDSDEPVHPRMPVHFCSLTAWLPHHPAHSRCSVSDYRIIPST